MHDEDRCRPGELDARRRDAPTDELILAALERARLHGGRQAPVPFWTLLEHLAIPRRSGAARSLRGRLAQLVLDGLAERSIRHGVPVWAPSRAALASLRRLLATWDELPESPQHRAWRDARVLAGQEVERFRRELRRAAEQALKLLAHEEAGARVYAPSDDWFALAHRLHSGCRRLGSATHILGEWREPGDATADLDDLGEPPASGANAPAVTPSEAGRLGRARLMRLRSGRRNTRLWDEGP